MVVYKYFNHKLHFPSKIVDSADNLSKIGRYRRAHIIDVSIIYMYIFKLYVLYDRKIKLSLREKSTDERENSWNFNTTIFWNTRYLYTCYPPNTYTRCDQWSDSLEMNKDPPLYRTYANKKNDTEKGKKRERGRNKAKPGWETASCHSPAKLYALPAYVRIMFTRVHMHLHKHDNGGGGRGMRCVSAPVWLRPLFTDASNS